ncbi:peptidylprolyl isomerase [Spirochaetia bacterium 38H-sp]|uniref:Peptidylprolyl isomerase n=1 Tax=Rarispira pelagica TaxID=3141764 RepID=A0ABU9UEY8_9SPIR
MKYAKVIAFLLVSASILSAQVLDAPVARIKLYKTEVVTQKQFKEDVELLESQLKRKLSLDEKKKMLDARIGEVLIAQAAENAYVTVSDDDVKKAVDSYKAQLGANIPDEQFKQLIAQQLGMSWDEFVSKIRRQLISEKYIMQVKGQQINSVDMPTNDEINTMYNQNIQKFTVPESIEYSHIFIDTRGLSDEAKKKAYNRAVDIKKEIGNSVKKFEDSVEKYSDDQNSRYNKGNVGTLFRTDAQRINLLGQSFFDKVFSIKVNTVSDVIESEVGYHIVVVKTHSDPKLLGLNDVIPGSGQKVYDNVKNAIILQRKQAAYKKAIEDLVKELRDKATVSVYDNNLNW